MKIGQKVLLLECSQGFTIYILETLSSPLATILFNIHVPEPFLLSAEIHVSLEQMFLVS